MRAAEVRVSRHDGGSSAASRRRLATRRWSRREPPGKLRAARSHRTESMTEPTRPDETRDDPGAVEAARVRAFGRSPAVGLVAGGGGFPLDVARGVRRLGRRVVCVGIRHEVGREIAAEVDAYRELGLGRIGALFRFFKRHGVRDVCWAGSIRKERLFTPTRIFSLLPDWRMIRLWYFRLRDRQSQTILGALADEFESEGLHVTHSAEFCPELLATEGLLSRAAPSRKQLEDIRFGWDVCQRMADLDVGQSVVVCDRSTIAVEGIEGTDRTIRRAGDLCRKGGFTVVKLPKRGHDMRFDVPAIGPATIATIHEAGGAVLAIRAGKTLIFEREETLRSADRHRIVVVAYAEGPDAPG